MLIRLRNEKRDKWWQSELGIATAKIKVIIMILNLYKWWQSELGIATAKIKVIIMILNLYKWWQSELGIATAKIKVIIMILNLYKTSTKYNKNLFQGINKIKYFIFYDSPQSITFD